MRTGITDYMTGKLPKEKEENCCAQCGKIFESDEVWDFCSQECVEEYENENPLRIINDYDEIK